MMAWENVHNQYILNIHFKDDQLTISSQNQHLFFVRKRNFDFVDRY